MSGLSTRHIVLGLLVERPGYGYDLQQRIHARFGFLGLAESAVYKILERLESDGWIEEMGEKQVGRTRRGAPRVMYQITSAGRQEFREWMATPCERTVLRDQLQTKLNLAEPDDIPDLLAMAEAQARECIAELAMLRRPVLAQAAEPDVSWHDAALLMVDDFQLRSLQTLIDWLDAICELMEERIQRISQASPPRR